MVAVVEIANLQRLAHGEHSGQPVYAVWLFGKHACTRKVKYRTRVKAGFEVYADYAVCNSFIHVI